jgi:Phosphoenolpyruvate carboxykinase
LTAYSGAKTGRSPLDKRVVKEPGSENDIWWGPVNKPMTPEVNYFSLFYVDIVIFIIPRISPSHMPGNFALTSCYVIPSSEFSCGRFPAFSVVPCRALEQPRSGVWHVLHQCGPTLRELGVEEI